MTNKYRFKVDKLIRDKLPAILCTKGMAVVERVMAKDEYSNRLKDKLLEPTHEVVEATKQLAMREELADGLEVIHAICAVHDLSFETVKATRVSKRLDKGGFDGRIYNAFVELDSNNPHSMRYQTPKARK